MNNLQAQLKKALYINAVSLITAGPLTTMMVMHTFSFYPEFKPQIRSELADIYMTGFLISVCGLPTLLYTLMVCFAPSGKGTRNLWTFIFLCLSSRVLILTWYIWIAFPYS